MRLFSSLFVKRGLSNSSTNMKNPLGYKKCLELCYIYDNWGGLKSSVYLKIGTPTGPGMELYEIFKGPKVQLGYGKYGQRLLYRGVIFAELYNDDKPVVELRVIEFRDLGDAGCPCFSVLAILEYVGGDLYRTPKPFTTYKDDQKMATVAEVNWNKATNEFVYREIHTPVNDND